MKKQNFKKNLTLTVTFAALMIFGAYTSAFAACVAAEGGIQTKILYAGQTIEAGSVTMEVVDTYLVVTYETSGDWELVEAQMWVGNDISDMPQTRQGNPKIGNFPYNSEIENPFSHSYSIPLTLLGFTCPSEDVAYFVAAHATVQLTDGSGNVIQTETGWADGSRFVERGMWGTFSTVTLTCNCDDPGVAGQCETAFAYSGGTNEEDGDITNSFLDIDEDGDGNGDFNRWGWSNGPVGHGIYTWDIYAGAGQSDITKGTLVGTLTVDYNESTATVTFNMTPGSGYYMDENHLYVGNEILARDVNNEFTVAPGQYPTIHDELNSATSDSYIIEGLSGDIYVVAHATVCGFE
ncbi:MAG: hypothetical protein LWX52_15350 [Deltaproteobacteria bacterium]|nr:hypothetical protein [Deltaproteobacteria bacterium]